MGRKQKVAGGLKTGKLLDAPAKPTKARSARSTPTRGPAKRPDKGPEKGPEKGPPRGPAGGPTPKEAEKRLSRKTSRDPSSGPGNVPGTGSKEAYPKVGPAAKTSGRPLTLGELASKGQVIGAAKGSGKGKKSKEDRGKDKQKEIPSLWDSEGEDDEDIEQWCHFEDFHAEPDEDDAPQEQRLCCAKRVEHLAGGFGAAPDLAGWMSSGYRFPAVCPHRHERVSVYDRLTDPRFYTGVSRHMFDEFGNGRGMAGREYVYLVDGNTESDTRRHEVYSTVLKRPRKPVVEPGTLGCQKYGVQAISPRLLWLYRNGDRHHSGEAFFMRSHVKSMDRLYFEINGVVKPIAGPVRAIYDQNFHLIKYPEEIVDGAKYLCTSGEPPCSVDRLQNFLSLWVYVNHLGR